MNETIRQQTLQKAIQANFRGHQKLNSKAKPIYPQGIEREFQRVTNAYIRLVNQVIINKQNITVDHPETKETMRLTEDLADEIFCGEPQDMFILAFEVIRFNFNGFFSKLGSRFGGAVEKLMGLAETSPNTGSST